MKNNNKNRKLRMEAFDLMCELKKHVNSRQKIIDKIHHEYGLPPVTLYGWYTKKYAPWGRREKLNYKPELFYVLGALLGDGCLYNWKITNHYVILVGDKRFTKKYSAMLTICASKKVKPYIDHSKNIWFVRTNNFKLYNLFDRVRRDLSSLERLLQENNELCSVLLLEGFFDAEGCVKIINDKARKVPKICLDITNTNYELLEVFKKILKNCLNIEASYSIQKPGIGKNGSKRKIAYHLRIYKKDFVRKFFDDIETTKLYPRKTKLLHNWLNNGK